MVRDRRCLPGNDRYGEWRQRAILLVADRQGMQGFRLSPAELPLRQHAIHWNRGGKLVAPLVYIQLAGMATGLLDCDAHHSRRRQSASYMECRGPARLWRF